MKQRYFSILFITFLLGSCAASYAQMVGVDIYLPGRYLEIGMNNTGAFGAPTPPAGYHPYPAGPLAEVYDYGHDGWTVGTPPFYGDYTYPGSPFEGWELQVNGVRNQAFTTGPVSAISGPGTMTGNNVSYVDLAGQLIANWAGTASGGNLSINMQTVVDTLGNTAVVTVIFRNTGPTAIPGVYYMRSCDPDNDEAHGGSFATNNTIVHQNELPSHAVEVDAEGALYGDHWSLATKDCRAVAFIYESWPMSITQDLAAVWSETYTAGTQYTLGGTLDGDYAFGIVYNLGTINAAGTPGDSAVISYAYIFNDTYSTIDSAFPDPILYVAGIPAVNSPIPFPTIDTFNSCLYPALTSIPVNITNATTGNFTWSTWTWAPATGLASTTGVTNTINVSALPTAITYTISGTDSASNGQTCNNKVFYLTILTCNTATNNSPCVGDTLKLFDNGDSTGATYVWYGPGGFTSTLQDPFIFPATFADSGLYHVIKFVGGIPDSGVTHVTITQPSSPGVTGNVPYCQYVGPFIPLTITTLPGATALWYTGPTGGTSSTTEPAPDLSTPGAYTTYVSQLDSTCESQREPVTIIVNPKPAPPAITNPAYCLNAVASPLTATGASLVWYGFGIAPAGTTTAPTPPTSVPAIDSYYVTQTVLGCISDSALDQVTVLPPPGGPQTFDTTYCQFSTAAPLSAIGTNIHWFLGGVPLTGTPVPSTTVPGTTTWYATQSTDTTVNTHMLTCESAPSPESVTTIYLPAFTITPSQTFVCQYDSINIAYTGPSLVAPGYSWVLPAGAHVVDGTDTVGMPSIVVQFDSATENNYVYLTSSDDSGFCQTTDTVRIKVVAQPYAHSYTNANVCLGDTTALSLASAAPDAYNYLWTIGGTPIAASGDLSIVSSSSNSGGPFTIYWLDSGLHIIQLNTTTVEGCASLPSFDTVDVHALPDAAFTYSAAASATGTFCIEDSLLFTANTFLLGNSYTWAPEAYFHNTNTPSSWGRIEATPTIITLTVTDAFGCTSNASQTFTPGTCCIVNFPNAFTPGDVARNRYFRPIAVGYHTFQYFRVANRWGQTVFESTNSNVQWDGTFNGVPQDSGVYYYYLKYDCGGSTMEQKGDVTLIR